MSKAAFALILVILAAAGLRALLRLLSDEEIRPLPNVEWEGW